MTLTREQVLEMGAGREMDSLIAENVMNWYITKGEYSGKEYWNDSDDYSHYSVQGFHPSTHILAAWEVLGKFEGDLYVKWDRKANLWESVIDFIIFNEGDARSSKLFVRGYGDSAPLSICRAALLTTIGEGT